MRNRVSVTWDHINSGVRGSSVECMLALALLDAGYINPVVTIGIFSSVEGVF